MKKEVEELLRKWESKLSDEIESGALDYSKEYRKFRAETLRSLSFYEKACKSIGKAIKLRISEKDRERLEKAIKGARLEIKPEEAVGLSIFTLIFGVLLSVLVSVAIFLLTNTFPFLVFLLLIAISCFLFYYLNTLPERLEQKWRLKASSQMVQCILYIVIYMRHTSNLERAIRFASQHLQPPLSLDLKRIFWEVETGKYPTVKDALDAYLEYWRPYALEFVEAMHLIESSLYEPVEERRIRTLEKSLEVMLDGVYEKMLHYVHDIKGPITNVYMLGIVLPTLGLTLLPLASTLLQGMIKWYHVALLFNIVVPFIVFYMTNEILSKRPCGFGETELLERNPNYRYYRSKKPWLVAFFASLPFFLIGISPFIFHTLNLDFDLEKLNIDILSGQKLFDFKTVNNKIVGPFGIGALLLSLFVPFSVALFFIIAYKLKTKKLVETRKRTKELELEFGSSLFQLANRLADGIPAEMAFGRVAKALKGTKTAGFFLIVDTNIKQAGMSVEEAVFNKARGAVNYYPSDLIKSSMKILIESVRKGLNVAARALMAISNYIKNIHKVNERLKDLLADITSGMRSNISFLAPILAAIVVGLAGMITTILTKLSFLASIQKLPENFMGSAMLEMFDVSAMIPPYFLQLSIGIYVIQIIFILTATLVTIESGEDRLGEKSEIANNLMKGFMLYMLVSFISIIALNALAIIAVSGIG